MILTLKINFRAKLHETHIVVFYDGRDVTKIVLICIVISGLEFDKVEKISKGSLDSIPSLSVKIQIMGGKFCLRSKGKTFENKKFVDITRQCFALLPQVDFPANNLNFH